MPPDTQRPDTTEWDELTIIDDATGLSVSVPILPGASILRSALSAMLIAEAMLDAAIAAEAANAR